MSYIESYEEDDDDFDRPDLSSALVRMLLGSALFPVGITIAMFFWAGQVGAEKALTSFASVEGVLWCLMTGMVWVVWHRCDRLSFLLVFFAWLTFTVGGNSFVCGKAVESLEKPYLSVSPFGFEEPFDYVVVLGGGTDYAPNENAQLNASGDRVMVAARMYLTGKAKHVICTGDNNPGLTSADTPTPAELTQRILLDLQVPEQDITLVKGRNTYQEIRALRNLFGEESPRVGIVTSAWHLPRAMRLAKSQDQAYWGIPSDFRTSQQPFTPLDLIPSTSNLTTLGQVGKEYLAKLAGR